jgi:hypothetical protein
MENTNINHPLHTGSKYRYTYRLNPFTNKYEWWWVDQCFWEEIRFELPPESCIVSYVDTWCEPTEPTVEIW